MNNVFLLLVCAPILGYGFSLQPFLERTRQPNTLVTRRVELAARAHLYAPSITLTLVLALVVSGIGLASVWWALGVTVICSAIVLMLPLRILVDASGISLGGRRPRRWTEFAGVKRVPRGIRLVSATGKRDLTLPLARERGDDEFVLLVRMLIRDSYKGTVGGSTTSDQASRDEGASSLALAIRSVSVERL